VCEADAIRFSAAQEHYGITVDQFDLCEVDSDDTVFPKRCAKDIQVISGHATADAKNDTLFEWMSVDSACHGGGLLPGTSQWQTERHPQSW